MHYLLASKKTGRQHLYTTLSALFADWSKDQLGISKHTVDRHTWEGSTDWKYENEIIIIKQLHPKTMGDVVLAKLSLKILESGTNVSVRNIGEVAANDFVFIYRKGIMLKDKSKSFASIEEVLKFLENERKSYG